MLYCNCRRDSKGRVFFAYKEPIPCGASCYPFDKVAGERTESAFCVPMKSKIDLSGMKFGRLTVIGRDVPHKEATKWVCICDCGKRASVSTHGLTSGKATSCGCYRYERVSQVSKKHGMKNSHEYKVWRWMKDRCLNKNCGQYPQYGGRGIKIADRWMEFQNFYADMGPCPDGMSIDRINVNGDYCPENCKWSTRKEQNNNKTNSVFIEYAGVRKTMSQWAEHLGMNRKTLASQIRKRGWSFEKVIAALRGDTAPATGKE